MANHLPLNQPTPRMPAPLRVGMALLCGIPALWAANITIDLDVGVRMRDGTTLSTNIFRPDASGRFPVLLSRTPYDKGGRLTEFANKAVQRGYCVVIQDTRGRF